MVGKGLEKMAIFFSDLDMVTLYQTPGVKPWSVVGGVNFFHI